MARKVSIEDSIHVAKKFTQHVVPGVVKPLHILWNQIIGFFFLVLAVLPIPRAVQAYRENNIPSFLLALAFVVIMGYFGLSSFWKARKVSRS